MHLALEGLCAGVPPVSALSSTILASADYQFRRGARCPESRFPYLADSLFHAMERRELSPTLDVDLGQGVDISDIDVTNGGQSLTFVAHIRPGAASGARDLIITAPDCTTA